MSETDPEVPDNPVVHFATRVGASTALCGANLREVGMTYTTHADMANCVDCIAALG